MIDLPYHTVLIKVDQCEPVAQTAMSGFVLFAQHEPYKVLIAHLARLLGPELTRHLFEYSLHGLAAESIALIPCEVFLINEEIVVLIQLPEPTVEDIEVLI